MGVQPSKVLDNEIAALESSENSAVLISDVNISSVFQTLLSELRSQAPKKHTKFLESLFCSIIDNNNATYFIINTDVRNVSFEIRNQYYADDSNDLDLNLVFNDLVLLAKQNVIAALKRFRVTSTLLTPKDIPVYKTKFMYEALSKSLQEFFSSMNK